MRRDERRFVLGWIYVVIAIACCIAGFITLRHDQIGAGVVFMAAMYGMALYADHMREYLIGQARAALHPVPHRNAVAGYAGVPAGTSQG